MLEGPERIKCVWTVLGSECVTKYNFCENVMNILYP